MMNDVARSGGSAHSPRGGGRWTRSTLADASRTSPADEPLGLLDSLALRTGVSSGRLLSGSPVISSFPGTLGAEYVEL
jgi:hypothetical protein